MENNQGNEQSFPKRLSKRFDLPVVPPLPPRRDPSPNPVVAICGECGLQLHQTMSYACSHPNCPTGLGSPMCCAPASSTGFDVGAVLFFSSFLLFLFIIFR